jgi:hypothetical protein
VLGSVRPLGATENAASWSSLAYGGGSGDFITMHIPDAAGRAFDLAGKVTSAST